MTPEQNRRVQLLIRYFVQRADDEGAPLTITKLVKLLYLVDVEYYRAHGALLTGLDWRFYFYGPYDAAIEDVLGQVGLDVQERPGSTGSGRSFRAFRPQDHATVELEPTFDWLTRSIIDEQWRDWGMADLNEVLSHVYFDTEPMLRARPMQHLEFSSVKPRPRVRALTLESTLPTATIGRLRQVFDERQAERTAELQYASEHGSPLSDEMLAAYSRALDVVQAEGASMPPGGLRGTAPSWDEFHRDQQ